MKRDTNSTNGWRGSSAALVAQGLLLGASLFAVSCTDTTSSSIAAREAAPQLTTDVPPPEEREPPRYVQGRSIALNHTPVFRIYKDSLAWFDEDRDSATLSEMGKIPGDDWFIHPLADCAPGIPSGTSVVVFTSNGVGEPEDSAQQSDPACQSSLASYLGFGRTLIVDMGDNDFEGGYQAPGSSGTPDLFFPEPPDDATLAPAALGPDGLLGTADDHPIVKGPDGLPGTGDDLTNENIDLCCYVAHGNLQDGVTLPPDARVLMTAIFNGEPKPILAEYCLEGGRVIVDTMTKEFIAQQPSGFGPSFFLRSLFQYAQSQEARCTFNFTGFFPPIANPPAVNVDNAGRAIPVKFSLDGDQGLNILAEGYPRSQQFSCTTGEPLGETQPTAPAGSSGLTYDPGNDQYHYVWKTERAWAGTCRRLIVRLIDGTDHTADFRFR